MTERKAPEDMTLAELEAELDGPIERDREEAVSASYYARMEDLRTLAGYAMSEFLQSLSQDEFEAIALRVIDADEYGPSARAVMREYAALATVSVPDADELRAERKRQERERGYAEDRRAQAEHDRDVIREATGQGLNE